MEGLNIITAIIIIFFAILQIILFFKVWNMTNNVNTIKNHLYPTDIQRELNKASIKGEKDKIKEILYNSLVEDLTEIVGPNEKMLNTVNVISNYIELYKRYDIEFPDRFKNIEKYADVCQIANIK